MKLSIIIPVFNSAASISSLVALVKQELSSHFQLEIVLVNDASTLDDSAEVCYRIASEDPTVKFLDLSRNYGEHNAVMAGLNYSTGEAAAIIDDDFQNPPREILKLVERLEDGNDVVFARYLKKRHSIFRNLGSSFNNFVASMVIGKPRELYLSSFKVINRFLIDEITKYRGAYPYIDGLILRTTDKFDSVTVEHHERSTGKSGYTVRKLVSLWTRMLLNFSVLPLRLATVCGLFFSVVGLVLALVFLVERFMHPELPAGWTSLIVTILILGGVQLFCVGMLGEYLGRLYLEANGKPQFVIRRTLNCESSNDTR